MLHDPLMAPMMEHNWLLGHVTCSFGQEDPVQSKLQLGFGQ